MEFLVLLEEPPDHSSIFARVDSVPTVFSSEARTRDVVTLYGVPNAESLALALAASMESLRRSGEGPGAFRHLGLSAERGAVGDAAWRDAHTGEMIMRDLDIPLAELSVTADQLLIECRVAIQRMVAGLAMPDWPEGAWRAITMTIDSALEPARGALSRVEGFLDNLREADGLTYEYEGD